MTGVALGGLFGTVSGATWPPRDCLEVAGVACDVPPQRSETLPAPWGAFGPWVLTMTFAPLFPVLNQSALMTAVGQYSGVSARVGRGTTVCARHLGAAITRTHTASLVFWS